MLRLMNVEAFFGKIASTLSVRWRSAPRDVLPETFTLSCGMGVVALVAGESELDVRPGETIGRVVELPDAAVTELVMGFRPAMDILADIGSPVEESVTRALDALFPVSIPFLSPLDHM